MGSNIIGQSSYENTRDYPQPYEPREQALAEALELVVSTWLRSDPTGAQMWESIRKAQALLASLKETP